MINEMNASFVPFHPFVRTISMSMANVLLLHNLNELAGKNGMQTIHLIYNLVEFHADVDSY